MRPEAPAGCYSLSAYAETRGCYSTRRVKRSEVAGHSMGSMVR